MYYFDKSKLKKVLDDQNKIPLVFVACGSFSPVTYLHLRMFEMAKDGVEDRVSDKYKVVGGYFSPVSDHYGKEGLAQSVHRVEMCKKATEDSTWLMVDEWESMENEYQQTRKVLEHFDECLNGSGGMLMSDGSRKRYKIMLLAGGDLIESFAEPGLWADTDVKKILSEFGAVVVERTGSDIYEFIMSDDRLYTFRFNVLVVKQLIHNDISSTKIRLFIKRNLSIRYLVNPAVEAYIYANRLYLK